jgi:hypothetical protein
MCLRLCHDRGPVRRFGRSKYQWSEIGGRLLQTSRRFDAMSKKRSAACQHLPARRSQSIRRCGPQTIQLIEPRLAPFVLLMQKLVFFRYLATCNYQENYSTSHGDIEQIYESEHGLAKFKRYCVVAHSQSYEQRNSMAELPLHAIRLLLQVPIALTEYEPKYQRKCALCSVMPLRRAIPSSPRWAFPMPLTAARIPMTNPTSIATPSRRFKTAKLAQIAS